MDGYEIDLDPADCPRCRGMDRSRHLEQNPNREDTCRRCVGMAASDIIDQTWDLRHVATDALLRELFARASGAR